MTSEQVDENMLSKRLNKILGTGLENDQETLDAIKHLSTFYPDNTIQARRNLRSQIEKRNLDINQNFLSAFRDVKDSFETVYNDLKEMSSSIQDMSSRLQNSKQKTKQLLDQTAALQNDNSMNDVQINILNSIIDKFQLTSAELTALHGNKINKDASITMDIFTALDHVLQIHSDCKILMQSGQHTLAFDIMEQMTLHQEGALERLYRWSQSNCKYVDNPEFTELITKSMERLQERPVLFKSVLDEYCILERAALVGEFIDALTRGGQAGNPTPIELRAHDPQIYVTDVLVWLNKAIPIEKQKLKLLLSLCVKVDTTNDIDRALTSICEGICHPLKIRIEKILTVLSDTSTLYSVTNLVRYYKKTIGKITSGGLFEETLSELQDKAEQTFLKCLQHQVDGLLVRVEVPSRDLTPTPAINNLLSILRDLLSTASMSDGRESDMGKIAQCVIDPLLRAVNEQSSRLSTVDMAVYMLNCMYAIFTYLSLYQYMDDKIERLQAQSDAQLDTLTSEQASSLVANLSLGPIYTILQDTTAKPLSAIPGMEPSNLRNFLLKLNTLLNNPDSLLIPQINLLSSSKHKNSIQKRSFEVLMAIYKQLYEAVHDSSNLYENPNTILDINPDELFKLINK